MMNEEDDGDVERLHDHGPLPTDAASFAAYLMKVSGEEFCEPTKIEEVSSSGNGHQAMVQGDAALIDEMIEDRHYLTERKGWFVSSVFGQGEIGGLRIVFQGTMRTMGDLVDISDEMDVRLWGGAQAPSQEMVDAFRLSHQERASRQLLDDIRYAVTRLQSIPEQAVAAAMLGQEQWVLNGATDLNNLLSRNVS